MNETFPQTAGATAKDRTLFAIARARASLLAAVQGLLAGSAERPLGDGEWNVRQTVLHVMTRDEAALRAFDDALANRASEGVPAAGTDAQANEAALAPFADTPWDEAMRLLHLRRVALLEKLEAVPAEPSSRWEESHRFGRLAREIARHDRHHADIIKRWRTEEGV